MAEPDPTVSASVLPAALLRLYADPALADLLAVARRETLERDGVQWLDEGLCAILPVAGDPAIFDLALTLGCEILARVEAVLGKDSADTGPAWVPRILVFPGQVEVRGGRWTVRPEALYEAFEAAPSALASGRILLTSRAATRLELAWRTEPSGSFAAANGLKVPLLRLLGGPPAALPMRSPELLRRRLPYVARPELDGQLARGRGSLRLVGLLGTGKGRSLAQALSPIPHGKGQPPKPPIVLWAQAQTARRGTPPLAAQLLARLLALASEPGKPAVLDGLGALGTDVETLVRHPAMLHLDRRIPAGIKDFRQIGQLLPHWFEELASGRPAKDEAPVTVVLDQLEAGTADELALADELVSAAEASQRFRVILVGRGGGFWESCWPALPRIDVPPLSASQSAELARNVFAGLELPAETRQLILDQTAGQPFAIEEALAALLHHGQVRQIYGSFFFSGSATPVLPASQRLVQHVEAESRRLGWSLPLRLLAGTGLALPPAVLAHATGAATPPGWAAPFLAAGWLASVPSPWGEAVTFTYPMLGTALAATTSDGDLASYRQRLGNALGEGRGSAWDQYHLLAGTPAGTTSLLAAAADGEARIPPEELRAALMAELARPPDEETTFRLLWQLLPLARRLGRLREHASDLATALRLAGQDPRRLLALAALAAELEEQEGHWAMAETTIRDVLRRASGQDQQAEAMLALRLARVLIRQERHGEARELLERLRPALEAAQATALHATCLFHLGNIASHQNRLEEALALHQQALASRRALRNTKLTGASLSALGRVSLRLGLYPEALAHYREAEEIFLAHRDENEVSFALLGLGTALSRLGDYAGAAAPLRRALALREKGDDIVGEAIARLAVAEHYLALLRPETALTEARKAHFDLRLRPTTTAALGDAEQLLGRILLHRRQFAEAAGHFAAAVEIHQRSKDREAVALDLAHWLDLTVVAGGEEEARRLAESLAEARQGLHLDEAESVELRLFRAWSSLARSTSEQERARDHLREAYRRLLAKLTHLSQEQRHRFLFQVPDHEAIVTAATREGMSFPGMPVPVV